MSVELHPLTILWAMITLLMIALLISFWRLAKAYYHYKSFIKYNEGKFSIFACFEDIKLLDLANGRFIEVKLKKKHSNIKKLIEVYMMLRNHDCERIVNSLVMRDGQ